MLYERWLRVVSERGSDWALRDASTDRSWSFAELNAAAAQLDLQTDLVLAKGNGPEFILHTLAAWRDHRPLCPVEVEPPSLRCSVPLDIAHVKTTSASGGVAKMVLFTGEAIAADADQIVSTMGLTPDAPNLGVISLAHSYGFSNLVTPLLLHGIPLILLSSPLPESLRQAALLTPSATLPAVPAMWNAWLRAGAIPRNLRLAISAGAPLPLALERQIYDDTGLKVHNFYGSTECGGIAYDRGDRPRSEETLVGTPMDGVEVTVSSEGCLSVKSAAVGSGYWPQPQRELAGGLFQTSDHGTLSPDGVRLLGRMSDLINVAGRKVAPEVIEAILRQHPGVRECVVFGVPSVEDPSRGDQIVATVAAALTEPELRQWVSDRLAPWQVPRSWWFPTDLRPNARGKISRVEWRQRWTSLHRSTKSTASS